MSRVGIEIPDDRWFRAEWRIRPQDKQLCVVITNENVVVICQFRKDEELFKDCFLSIDKSEYISWMLVERWKPLGLPADANKRVLAEIEKWFEEDEPKAACLMME